MSTERTRLMAATQNALGVAQQWKNRGLTEQDTKNAIIEPLLGAMGWPKDDLALVRAEYRHTR